MAFIDFNDIGWNAYSKEMKGLAKRLLTKISENRISLAEIANMKWMKMINPLKNELNSKESSRFSIKSKPSPSRSSFSSICKYESKSSFNLIKLQSKSFIKLNKKSVNDDKYDEDEEELGIKTNPSNYSFEPHFLYNKKFKVIPRNFSQKKLKKLGHYKVPSCFENYSVIFFYRKLKFLIKIK